MSGQRGPFVENNFFNTVYTGNGAARNIVNNLDLAGRGGMVISRRRDSPLTGVCSDTVTGVNNGFYLGAAAARTNFSSPTSFAADGYALANAAQFNTSGGTYVSWAFKRAARFFDIVTFTSDGTTNQRIPHSLGIAPGMAMVHAATASSSFIVYNKGAGRDRFGTLSTTDAFSTATNSWGTSDPTAIDIGFNGAALGLSSGTSCVMYLFADDAAQKGLIRSGIVTTSAGALTANFGWAPELLLIKLLNGVSGWECFDQTRGWATGTQRILDWNGSNAENNTNVNIVLPTSTGFQISGGWTNEQIAFLAIRKGPMKT